MYYRQGHSPDNRLTRYIVCITDKDIVSDMFFSSTDEQQENLSTTLNGEEQEKPKNKKTDDEQERLSATPTEINQSTNQKGFNYIIT